jgi:hypothetical protein
MWMYLVWSLYSLCSFTILYWIGLDFIVRQCTLGDYCHIWKFSELSRKLQTSAVLWTRNLWTHQQWTSAVYWTLFCPHGKVSNSSVHRTGFGEQKECWTLAVISCDKSQSPQPKLPAVSVYTEPETSVTGGVISEVRADHTVSDWQPWFTEDWETLGVIGVVRTDNTLAGWLTVGICPDRGDLSWPWGFVLTVGICPDLGDLSWRQLLPQTGEPRWTSVPQTGEPRPPPPAYIYIEEGGISLVSP